MALLARLALALVLMNGCVLTVENGRVEGLDLGGDPIASGRRVYATRCASCHGLTARGDGPVGPALRTTPPDLTWLAERNGGTFPRDYVVAVITGHAAITAHGTSEMPVWSDRFVVSDGDGASAAASLYVRRTVEALADYLASLQRRLAAQPSRHTLGARRART
jgi:mono/diheme cytochrome c family protein